MTGTLIRIALRNLFAHKVKSLIVGGILVMGTTMVLLGASALTSMDNAMSQSLTASISGHLQISAKDAKDKFVLFPSPIDGTEVGELKDFPRIRRELEALPEVRAVVPQGFDYALLFGGNLLDIKLAKLRELQKAGKVGSPAWVAKRDHVRRIVELLSVDLKNLEAITDEASAGKETWQGIANVRKAAKPEFWQGFEDKLEEKLVYLENKVAVMAIGEDMLFIRYMGTDTLRFRKEFRRFEMLEGEPIPDGQRGIMLNHFAYEQFFKHKTARRLDRMKERVAEGYTIAGDDQLKDWNKQNVRQYKEVIWQLDNPAAEHVRGVLQKELASKETDLVKLVKGFLDLDDANFERRYGLFYEHIAPRLLLYRANVGDVITIRGQGAGGYAKSANVKIYGVFQFRGLEKSVLAGAVNVVDMMSFRDLYGFMTADKVKELQDMEKSVGVAEVERKEAEDAFFGGGDNSDDAMLGGDDSGNNDSGNNDDALLGGGDSAEAAGGATATGDESAGFDEFAGIDMKEGAQRWSDAVLKRKYTQPEIDGGVVRNAAVMLKEGVSEAEGMKAIEAKADALGIQVMNWRKASGMLGDLVSVIYVVLSVLVLAVYGVALFIINNSMVLATLERTREIGTLRAIGMQQRHVLWMFIVESLVLGAVFGFIGAVVGSSVVAWVGSVGIPAGSNDTVRFLFGGPRLYPGLEGWHVGVALVLVALVTIVSTIYPAFLATRVTPLEAMQEGEG